MGGGQSKNKKMPLSLQEIRQLEKEPINKKALTKAVAHQEKLKFHTEPRVDRSQPSRAATDFLTFVSGLMPKDKFYTFGSLFRFPAKTVRETERVFSALETVFDGRNPIYKYEFTGDDAAEDWSAYRENVLNAPDVWRTKGMENLRLAINSVVIVDLPRVQESTRPEPYFYWLDVSMIEDFEAVKDELQWIRFTIDELHFAVIDDASYRIFEIEEGMDTRQDPKLIHEAEHDLGYCPARFFWSESMNQADRYVKKSPLTVHLGDLDWMLFFMVNKMQLDTYAGNPIYWMFEVECDYERDADKNGEYARCKGGFLVNEEYNYIEGFDGNLSKCPVCSQKSLVGAGSVIEVPLPSEENGDAVLGAPAGILAVDRQSLDYNVLEEERLVTKVFNAVTGFGSDLVENVSLNETQVMANFESRRAVLIRLKKNFEIIQKWVDSTIARLRYGDQFVSCMIDYGTEFFLFEPEYILELYGKARTNKLDDSVLTALQDQYVSTKYRNNPDQLRREMILKNLDPFRHLTKPEVTELYTNNQILYVPFMIKLNFGTYINRFEREQASLLKFGEALEFDDKINKINEILKEYANEAKPAPIRQEVNTGESGVTA